jgi:Tfp pilus assembly pilus retraction ATPase PilT
MENLHQIFIEEPTEFIHELEKSLIKLESDTENQKLIQKYSE